MEVCALNPQNRGQPERALCGCWSKCHDGMSSGPSRPHVLVLTFTHSFLPCVQKYGHTDVSPPR